MEYPLDEATTRATREEKSKLRKGFRGFDMLFYTMTAVIAINGLGAFSANGAQALTWLSSFCGDLLSALRTPGSGTWQHLSSVRYPLMS